MPSQEPRKTKGGVRSAEGRWRVNQVKEGARDGSLSKIAERVEVLADELRRELHGLKG